MTATLNILEAYLDRVLLSEDALQGAVNKALANIGDDPAQAQQMLDAVQAIQTAGAGMMPNTGAPFEGAMKDTQFITIRNLNGNTVTCNYKMLVQALENKIN